VKENVVILGAGAPAGLGGALTKRFAKEGYHLIVSGRTQDKIDAIAEEVSADGGSIETCRVDVTSSDDQDKLFKIAARNGEIAAVIYNAGNNARTPFEELTAESFEQFWKVCCFGGFLTAQRAMPILRKQGKGSMLFTGASASLRGKANFAHFASSKGALRNMAQSLAREYGPHGVHVAHFIIDGIIDGPKVKEGFPEFFESLGEEGTLSADAIADTFMFTHKQPRSTWSHEIDLRPFKETW